MGTRHYNVEAALFMQNFTNDLKAKGLITQASQEKEFTTIEEDGGQSVAHETVEIGNDFFAILEPLLMDLIVKILPSTEPCTTVPSNMKDKLFLTPLNMYKLFTDKFPITKDSTIASDLLLGIRMIDLEELKKQDIHVDYVVTKEELQYKIY